MGPIRIDSVAAAIAARETQTSAIAPTGAWV
jgi:hypothetical protein